MSASVELTGGCLCGAVRYRVTAQPAATGLCYCQSCQKLSGSGRMFNAMVAADALRIEGQTRAYAWTADSGSTVTTSFCPTCGSPLFGESSGFPGMMAFRVASLDDPSAIAPQMVVYTKRMPPWDHLIPGVPAFPEMPPMSAGG